MNEKDFEMLREMGKKYKRFAGSGDILSERFEFIIGRVINKITFISDDFCGTMDSQVFWDNLANYAKKKNAYVFLMYK